MRSPWADPQQPHTEDEVYYVVSGQGLIQVGTEDRRVDAGTVVFVKAGVPHRFYKITEDLTMLVFFAPSEGSQIVLGWDADASIAVRDD